MLSALKYDERFPSADMFGDMESEIAELRTMTRVTKLRRQIETRQEGAWMTVRDVPDDRSSSGTRKVTTYGRATRSVTRSFTSDVNINDFLSSTTVKDGFTEPSNGAIVEFPEDEHRSNHSPPKNDVEITEIVDNEPEPTYGVPIKTSPTKKTSVVTLGQGNVVLIDPEDSNFKVTGISKGANDDSTSKSGATPNPTSKTEDSKKVKKVGFSKTEVHFAPDSGKVNIVETDEKPPSSQVLRRKKKPRKETQKPSMPKLYFGDLEKEKISAVKSLVNDAPNSRVEHVFPVIREPSPLLSTSIANQARTVKESWHNLKKDDVNSETGGYEFRRNSGFNSISDIKPVGKDVEESVLKPNESWSKEGTDFSRKSPRDDADFELNGYAEVKEKIGFKTNTVVKSVEKGVHLDEYVPRPRELNERWSTDGVNFSRKSPKNADPDLSGYAEVKTKISFNSSSDVKSVEKGVSLDESVNKQLNGSWSTERASFLRNVSPKLSKLISNNMQHEFQQKQMEILRKSREAPQQGVVVVGGGNVVDGDVPVAVNIHVSSDESRMKVKPVKIVAQVKVSLEERKAKAGQEPKREPVYVNEVKGVTRTINVVKEDELPKPKSSLTKIVLDEGKERKRTKSISKSSTLERVGRKSATPTIPVKDLRPKKEVPKREVAVVKPMKPAKGTLTRPEPCRRSRPAASDGLRPLRTTKDPVKREKAEAGKARGDKAELSKARGEKTEPGKSKKSKEPLRSFEKVSNGWVGHIVPVKAVKGGSKVSITTTTASATHTALSSTTNPGTKRDTDSSEHENPVAVRVENKFHTRSSLTSAKQFSLSKEHLKSAKLVKELHKARADPKPDIPLPKSSSQRPKPEEWASQRSKGVVSRRRLMYEEGPHHVRRDSEQSDDSVIRADEEVRAYMFNSKTKNNEC